jgi:hypothetical protein
MKLGPILGSIPGGYSDEATKQKKRALEQQEYDTNQRQAPLRDDLLRAQAQHLRQSGSQVAARLAMEQQDRAANQSAINDLVKFLAASGQGSPTPQPPGFQGQVPYAPGSSTPPVAPGSQGQVPQQVTTTPQTFGGGFGGATQGGPPAFAGSNFPRGPAAEAPVNASGIKDFGGPQVGMSPGVMAGNPYSGGGSPASGPTAGAQPMPQLSQQDMINHIAQNPDPRFRAAAFGVYQDYQRQQQQAQEHAARAQRDAQRIQVLEQQLGLKHAAQAFKEQQSGEIEEGKDVRTAAKIEGGSLTSTPEQTQHALTMLDGRRYRVNSLAEKKSIDTYWRSLGPDKSYGKVIQLPGVRKNVIFLDSGDPESPLVRYAE